MQEKILIADDEDAILEYCSAVLTDEGYEVVTAGNGVEAVERARTERYALLLADISMPRMDGMETFRAIREFDPDIVGVVITGYGTLENALRALRLGFSWFLTKPFTVDELTSSVERTLERVRLGRDNARLRALVNLHELAQATGPRDNISDLLANTLEMLLKEAGGEVACVALIDEASGEVVPCLSEPAGAHEEPAVAAALGFMAERVLATRLPGAFLRDDAGDDTVRELMGAAGLAASMCVPLAFGEEIIGVVTAHTCLPGETAQFSEADIHASAVICAHAAIGISNARLRHRLEGLRQEVIDGVRDGELPDSVITVLKQLRLSRRDLRARRGGP